MSNIESRITAAREKVATLATQKSRAEAKREMTLSAYNKSLDSLKADYGVESLQEAVTLLKSMEEKVDSILSEVEESL